MAYDGVILQCLISSPSDLGNDLEVVHGEIIRWNGGYGRKFRTSITPVVWNINAAPMQGGPAQDILDEQLVDQCDMAIALFAARLGTPTKNSVSGTASEIERLAAAGKPVGVLRSRKHVDPATIDPEQARHLNEYLTSLTANGLLMEYKKKSELIKLVGNFIEKVISKETGISAVELGQTMAADVWPSVEDRIRRILSNGSVYRRWVLVLENHGNAPAHDVRVETQGTYIGEIPWDIVRGPDRSRPDVEVLAPAARVEIPISDSLAATPRARCIVTFKDDRGEHLNTAMLGRY